MYFLVTCNYFMVWSHHKIGNVNTHIKYSYVPLHTLKA
ncbi:hypothetical protein NTHI1209_02193 [Haemophilus influenzae]|uniref:Uncharacterized protein n=1 Tax=Haemophilus influenzae TaxID=727 RepID=A0A158T094_HAEIF|nr:hypothetical protein NTHI1209_02193 [Haemophilus influenzae]